MDLGARQATSSVYAATVQRIGLTAIHKAILGLVPPSTTVLELGPSSGYMTKALSEQGCTVDAIELNPRDAEQAAAYCRKMVVGSAEDPGCYAQLTGPYRTAIMADVLEHLRSPETALREVRKRLSSEGHAIVSLPNIAYWKIRLDLLKGKFEYKDLGILDRTHLRFYTQKTAGDLFAREGFRLIDTVITPPKGPLRRFARTSWPSMFALQIVYHLRVA
jgi:2-polyprenyl-3-methyl-5-hydroxy-6-metoxy-1,4-benzoquinol methylase